MSLAKLEEEYENYMNSMGYQFDNTVITQESRRKKYEYYEKEITDPKTGKPFDNIFKDLYTELKNEDLSKGDITKKENKNDIIKEIQTKVESTYKSLGYEIPENILVKQNPSGVFNASILPFPSGYIIFLNSGLISLLHKIVKVIAWHSVSEMEGNDPSDDTVYWLTTYIDGYLSNEFDATRLPVLEGIPSSLHFIFGQLLDGAEFFVLAHEYGHYFNREREGQIEKHWRQNSDVIDVFEQNYPSYNAELHADRQAAIGLLHYYYKWQKAFDIKRDEQNPNTAFSSVLAGGLLVISLTNLIIEMYALKANKITFFDRDNNYHEELYKKIVQGDEKLESHYIYTTHPPSKARHNEICLFWKENLTQIELDHSLVYPNWFYYYSDLVINLYRQTFSK